MRRLFFLFVISLLQAAQIQIGGQLLTVEIARTQQERSIGLMGREHLADGQGMLFIYEEPQELIFWMKNTLIPLSIAFFDAEQRLLHTLDMDPPKGGMLPLYKSKAPALYALEVPQGWFKKHGIGIGFKFTFLDPENPLH